MLTSRIQTKNKSRLINFARIAALFAAFGIALVTGVATFLLFPKLGISFAISVGVAGLVIELKTYWQDTQKATSVIFIKGIFSNLENNLVAREILKDELITDLFAIPNSAQSNKKLTKKWIKRQLENGQSNFQGFDVINKIKTNIKNELLIKKTLCAIALIYAIFNGISTVAITYTHTNFIMQQRIPVFTFLLAVVCGYAYSQIMYRLLARSIEKNSAKKLLRSLKKTFIPSKSFREMKLREYVSFAIKSLTVSSLFLSVLALSTLVTFFSGTTLLNQNIQFLQAMVNLFAHLNYSATIAINITSAILIYGFFLPTAFLFAFENSWETVHGVIKKITPFLREPQILKRSIIDNVIALKNNPKQCWKIPGYIAGLLIVTIALILHVIGEGARSSESLINRSRIGLQTIDHISVFFEKIVDALAKKLNITPTLYTVISESILEILEHLPFLQGHHHGSSVTTFCAENSYQLINRLFGREKVVTTINLTQELKTEFSSVFKRPVLNKAEEIQEIELLIQSTPSF